VLSLCLESGNLLAIGEGHERVDVEVIFDDGSLQEELDDRYGAAVVAVTSALRRV
jgi:hypothetical protein